MNSEADWHRIFTEAHERAKAEKKELAPWSGTGDPRRGIWGRPADAARGSNITGSWASPGRPEGADRRDRVDERAMSRIRKSKAGKSPMRSRLATRERDYQFWDAWRIGEVSRSGEGWEK